MSKNIQRRIRRGFIMKLIEKLNLDVKYLIHLRWSHTILQLSGLGIILFLLTRKSWIALVLFIILFFLEDFAYNKKITKIELGVI